MNFIILYYIVAQICPALKDAQIIPQICAFDALGARHFFRSPSNLSERQPWLICNL